MPKLRSMFYKLLTIAAVVVPSIDSDWKEDDKPITEESISKYCEAKLYVFLKDQLSIPRARFLQKFKTEF